MGRRRGGTRPTLLLAHASGSHARCWDPVIRRLGARHVIALDQRGHGCSEVREIQHWRVFGEDRAAFVRALMDFSSSPTWAGLASEFRNGREIHLPDHTRFLSMEIPDRIAELIATEAGDG